MLFDLSQRTETKFKSQPMMAFKTCADEETRCQLILEI
jgi:hypothetical protein